MERGVPFREKRRLAGVTVTEGGLCALGVPLEVRIWHDAPTFNATYFSSPVFLLRHTVRDQAYGYRRKMGSLRWAEGLVLTC